MYQKVYETRSFNSKERVKYLSWTIEMDRCLAKALAEQVKKGYKIDNTLKPVAYSVALSALNEKFGHVLTKEHIKNRLKTWRKQFGILNEILAQKGFEWDEKQKMVVADNSVWNNYIKEHPDARLFRSKFIENYDELCIIIGKDRAIARSSKNGAENVADLTADEEDDDAAIASEIRIDDTNTTSLRWTEEMDSCLGQILVEQVEKGCNVDNILQSEAYDTVLTALIDNFGSDLTKDHVQNRLRTWKKDYGILKELLFHTEFKWDETRKMIIANDSAWNNYVKNHPDASLFRGRVVKSFDALWVIFGYGDKFESYIKNDDGFASSTPETEAVEAADTSQIQSGCAKEQSKYMTWTKEMDSCLGRILVEQVKQGNKIDSSLKSSAYTVAATALNKRFHLDLMKDHIRNRLRTWRKQYGILKELLERSEFEWDETRKMVSADASTWNDYIKTHPDARIFRGRIVENYDEWCVIFRNSNATESFSRVGNDAESCFAGDAGALETVGASPIGGIMKDQVRNVRWTNEMDQCLSKILVEQVKLGNKNKSDNKLKTAAYLVAVSVLNERFQLDLSKDHVKNRLKTWKKLYGTVKELLEQSEFAWDDKQKMVVADDLAWYYYMKRNPDVRFIQGRIIENYDELCVIIGNDDPTGSSSLNDAEVDLDMIAENDGLETEGAFCNNTDNVKGKGKYVLWTDEMDRCLIEKLIEQVNLGNKLEKSFKPVAYTAALTVLNDKFSRDLTKDNIRSRLKTWRKFYGLVKELLSHNGFEWDERQKMIVANDSVWNEYIKRHPDARFLRARSMENYDELRIIIGNEKGTGYCSRTITEVGANPANLININNEERVEAPTQVMLVDEEMSHGNTGDGMDGSSQQTRARPSSSSRSKQQHFRKRSAYDVMIEMMSDVAANIGRIADALTESNTTVCLDDLFEMVQNIDGFDDDLVIEACEFLSFDDKRAKMFMKLNDRLRKKWLLKRLRGPV